MWFAAGLNKDHLRALCCWLCPAITLSTPSTCCPNSRLTNTLASVTGDRRRTLTQELMSVPVQRQYHPAATQ